MRINRLYLMWKVDRTMPCPFGTGIVIAVFFLFILFLYAVGY